MIKTVLAAIALALIVPVIFIAVVLFMGIKRKEINKMNKYVKESFRDMVGWALMCGVPLLISIGLVVIAGLIGEVIANEVGCVLGCCVGVILSLIFIPIYEGLYREREEKRKINEKYTDALERMKRHLREKGEEL